MSAGTRDSLDEENRTRSALARFEADGFISQSAPGVERWKTSRRWQQAMARAAAKLYALRDEGDDLRVPIALAIVEIYAGQLDDETLAELVETMLPIEAASLGLGPNARS
jgi:hypothetical protein